VGKILGLMTVTDAACEERDQRWPPPLAEGGRFVVRDLEFALHGYHLS
jgi:hypothetical protein